MQGHFNNYVRVELLGFKAIIASITPTKHAEFLSFEVYFHSPAIGFLNYTYKLFRKQTHVSCNFKAHFFTS